MHSQVDAVHILNFVALFGYVGLATALGGFTTCDHFKLVVICIASNYTYKLCRLYKQVQSSTVTQSIPVSIFYGPVKGIESTAVPAADKSPVLD